MGVRRRDYGNACATARTEVMSELAKRLNSGMIQRDQVDHLTETFVAAMHRMPSWALRSIADSVDPALPET